ncbi:MAG: helix-turn-helix transcriptional regulator [Selenomonadaceae bacterium]|nr:helix-turn-helix transcriptional regulator [Selenomonadaceae bacterium]
MQILGERLRELRLKKELKQEVLVKEFSLATATYSMYETGQRNPPLELLIKFAAFYDVSTDYLLGRIPTYYPDVSLKKNISYSKFDLINTILEIPDRFCPKIIKYIHFLSFDESEDTKEVPHKEKKFAIA